MKNYYMFVVAGLSVLAMALAGCASQPTTSNTPAPDPQKSTHTQEELKKTGRQDTGDALQATDPSVQSTGR
jgi:esterase/lipase superfamily enzyme